MMKSTVIALTACLGMGLQVASAAPVAPIGEIINGRYAAYDLVLKGTGLDAFENKGKVTYNGNLEERFDAVKKVKRTARGVVIEDMAWGQAVFITPYKGGYEIWDAGIQRNYILAANRMNMSETEDYMKMNASGVRALEIYLEGEGVGVYCGVLGRWNLSAKVPAPEMKAVAAEVSKGDEEINVSFVGTGTGVGYDYVFSTNMAVFGESMVGPTISMPEGAESIVPVKQVKTRLNMKMTEALNAAYETGTNDVTGIEAASAVLNEYINNKAEIDDADFNLSWLD